MTTASKGGRPTKYKASMGDDVVRLMSEGKSKVQVCAELEIHYSTFIDWQNTHPEFSESVKEGERLSQAWWEEKLTEAALGANKDANATLMIFNMKNRFPNDWRDKHELAHSGQISSAKELTDDELARIAAGSGAGASKAQKGKG